MNYPENIDLQALLPIEWANYIDKTILQTTECKLQTEISKSDTHEFYPFDVLDIFKIFHLCNLQDIKVVILGQDPYYSDKSQANGLAFSVNKDVRIPPSLRNIFKLCKGVNKEGDGDLTHWVKQGVFLLNTSLTVRQKAPNSHHQIWNEFTEHVIDVINRNCNDVIFVAWGSYALEKYRTLDLSKHHLLCSSHPSPLSCYKTDKPFFDSDVFNRINFILLRSGKRQIFW